MRKTPETPLLNTQITFLPYCRAELKAISNTISVSYSVNVKMYYVGMLVLKLKSSHCEYTRVTDKQVPNE